MSNGSFKRSAQMPHMHSALIKTRPQLSSLHRVASPEKITKDKALKKIGEIMSNVKGWPPLLLVVQKENGWKTSKKSEETRIPSQLECAIDEGRHKTNGKQTEGVICPQGMLVFQIVRLPC